MDSIDPIILSQCQTALKTTGICQFKMNLPDEVKQLCLDHKLIELDHYFGNTTQENGTIFNLLQNFINFKSIEYIVSYRHGDDPDEEDGIWHDDGSRKLAYSISLTTAAIKGGEFLFRYKGNDQYRIFPTPSFGTMTVFQTGQNNFEHMVKKVDSGKRIITAGWCT